MNDNRRQTYTLEDTPPSELSTYYLFKRHCEACAASQQSIIEVCESELRSRGYEFINDDWQVRKAIYS